MNTGKRVESVAGMKKPGLCVVLIHRLAALCLSLGDGEARDYFAIIGRKNEGGTLVSEWF